jgi:hypothetical protein
MYCNEVRADWKLHIDADNVLRAIGAVMRTRRAHIVRLVENILAERGRYLRPRSVMRAIAVRESRPDRLVLEGGVELRSETLCRKLAGSQSIVAIVGTIGNDFQIAARDGAMACRLILDGIGTVAVTALIDRIIDGVQGWASGQGLQATNAVFPGMKGWALAEAQSQIFALVDGSAVGVSLNESFMMAPAKSVSLLVGVGPQVVNGLGACEDCGAVAHCHYKTQFYVR